MKSQDYIIEHQDQWAKRNHIQTTNRSTREYRPYVLRLENNLFEKLPSTSPRLAEYGNAAGQELREKMLALHSSSAIAVNVFEYWRDKKQLQALASVLPYPDSKIIEMELEAKLPIMERPKENGFPRDPHLDVLFKCSPEQNKLIGVECKFATDAYSGGYKKPMEERYHDNAKLWVIDRPSGLGALNYLKALDREVSHLKKRFRFLDSAQLIKHILGLRYSFIKKSIASGTKQHAPHSEPSVCLLYIWYEGLKDESDEYRAEIDLFKKAAVADGVVFESMTWQDLISRLQKKYARTHPDYINYLVERYL
jgi:hypothetical protein